MSGTDLGFDSNDTTGWDSSSKAENEIDRREITHYLYLTL